MQAGAELGAEEKALVEGLQEARLVGGSSRGVHEDPPGAGGVHTNDSRGGRTT